MWVNDSEYWIGEFEFNEFPDAVVFIDKVTNLASGTELKSLWKERLQIAKIKVKVDRNSDSKTVMKKIDNIYFKKR